MEKDQQLKEILLRGSERASVHFTDAVMERVQQLSVSSFYSQPLVPPRLKKAFVLVFAGLVGAIFLTCLLIVSPPVQLGSWIDIQSAVAFLGEHSYSILTYIGCFWILFGASWLAEKKRAGSGNMSF